MLHTLAIVPLVASLPLATAHGSEAAERVPAGQPLEQSVLVERAHWPVLIRPFGAHPNAATLCASVEPDQIELLQDGEPLTVTAVGPRPLPRLHALLVDTSQSMILEQMAGVTLLEEARRAAVAYVDGLPDEDALLVAAFDESMVLGTPPTFDRDAARRAVERLEAGYSTALWDALYYLVLYLKTLPGEKIVVLLTDGEDSSSLKEHRFDRVLRLTSGVPNLTVFPIGIDLPGSVARGIPLARGKLGALARQSGGEFFEMRQVGWLKSILRRTRERVENQIYVSYIPRPRPAAAGVSGSGAGGRRPRLKIRLDPDLPCKLLPLGVPGRNERVAPATLAELDQLEPTETGACATALDASGDWLGAQSEVDAGLRLRFTEGNDTAAAASILCSVESREAMVGQTEDLLIEQGPLFRRKPWANEGRLRIDTARKPAFGLRSVAVLTPAVQSVRDHLTDPAALLLHLLERELPDPPRSAAKPYRAPFMVHGQTFLELRELIGRVLFNRYPDYRDWALKQVEHQVHSDLQALLDRSPAAQDLSEEQIGDLRQAMLARSSDPLEGCPHLPLAQWLGDVDARQAVLELERRLTDSLLRGGENGQRNRVAIDRVARSWWKLSRWFPPAIDGRILTPLVPVYDREREQIGFYRFLLPWPRLLAGAPETVPTRALALRGAVALADRPGLLSLLGGELGVVALSYDDVDRDELREIGCAALQAGHRPTTRVVLELAGEESAERERPLRLAAYWVDEEPSAEAADRPGPSCWRVEAEQSGSPRLRRIGEFLDQLLSASGAED
jgi:hypothetical protein